MRRPRGVCRNAEAGQTTAVASRAGSVARYTGPQRRRLRAATPCRRPLRSHLRMRAEGPRVRPCRLSRPREPGQSGRARAGDATRAHGGRGGQNTDRNRRPTEKLNVSGTLAESVTTGNCVTLSTRRSQSALATGSGRRLLVSAHCLSNLNAEKKDCIVMPRIHFLCF